MQFGPIDRVILFGGAPLLVATARQLRVLGMETRIYTSPRHVAEVLNAEGLTLAEALRQEGLAYVSTEDINSEPSLPAEISASTLGIGMGEAWSFSPRIIQLFGGRLLDFMGIPHPRYRGGAHYTWMILGDDRSGGCNLQVINEDMVQGEFDSGEIVKSRAYRFPAHARTPQDYFAAALVEEVAFIQEFLAETKAGVAFSPKKPDESKSLFFPRLNTIKQGWIDWAWTGREIERFICAFDSPYAGASTRVLGVRVHLKDAVLDDTEVAFHPFQSGVITRVTPEEGCVVATRSGVVKIKSVTPASGETLPREPAVGDRFNTPDADLESALAFRASYGTTR